MAPSGRHSSRAPHIARALEHSTMLARRHLAPRLSSSRLDRSARDARCSFARVITPRRHRKRISVTTSAGLFQSKEEKIVERYLNSKEGHAAILKAKKEGKSKKELLKMHKKDISALVFGNRGFETAVSFDFEKPTNGVCELPERRHRYSNLKRSGRTSDIYESCRRHSRCHRTTVQISG